MPKIARDLTRFNTSSGRAHDAPNVRESGTSTVARVMRKAEKPQPTQSGASVVFTIEEGNHAKRINQDAMPR